MEIEWGQSRGGVVEKVFVRGPPPGNSFPLFLLSSMVYFISFIVICKISYILL